MKPHLTFNHNPLLERSLSAWRPRAVLLLLLCGSCALVLRAAYLQIFNTEFLQAEGESRFMREISVPATRGRITDRNGELLAISTPVKAIWANPREISAEPAQLRELAGLLEMNVDTVSARLNSDRSFVYLRRQLPPHVATDVMALGIRGVYQLDEFRRFYPAGEVTSHVLGFTDVDEIGKEGVELAYHEQLKGHPGLRRVIRDNRRRIIQDVESIREPRNGQDLVLAMDSRIQFIAHAALREAVAHHRAAAGSVVVLDARTGEVLALVNAPTYNANNRGDLSGAHLRNRAVTDLFEPGSTIKPFTAALALEYGKARSDTVIDLANGRITMGRHTISDVRRPRGPATLTDVVKTSSNVGTVRLAMQFRPDEMWGMFNGLGFGSPVGIGFPGEGAGRLRSARNWRPIEQATMSYGHGLSATLLQIARAYTVFTSDGVLLPVSLLRQDGSVAAGERVFSPDTARAVRQMLELATGPQGTGGRARTEGYTVAGKTGTAHKLEGGVYVNKYISSFVGFAPATNPRLIVAVMIDEPSAGQHFGGLVAAPVFSRVVDASLRTLGVAPDINVKVAVGEKGAKP